MEGKTIYRVSVIVNIRCCCQVLTPYVTLLLSPMRVKLQSLLLVVEF